MKIPWNFSLKIGGAPNQYIYILFGASRGSPWGTRIGPESDKIGPKSDKFRQKSRMLVFPKEFQWLSPPGGAPWALFGPTLTGFGPILGRLGWPRTIDFPKGNQWFRKIVKILMKFQENSMNFRSKVRKVQICYELLLFWSLPEGAKIEKSMIFYENSMKFHKKFIKMGKCADSVYIYIYEMGAPPGALGCKKVSKWDQMWPKVVPRCKRAMNYYCFGASPGSPRNGNLWNFFNFWSKTEKCA